MLIHNIRELGVRMRDRRLELGLTQAELARRIGVTRFWVIQVERGSTGAEIGRVFKALAVLGLELDVRPVDAPAARSSEADAWTPNLAQILERARGLRR